MPRHTHRFSLPAILAAVLLAAPCSAHAGAFVQKWVQQYLVFDRVVGNTDADPQDELLFHDLRDNTMVLVDGLTGTAEIGFPEFKYGEAEVLAKDIDNDSRLELVLHRAGGGPTVPLIRVIKWTPSGWTQLFAHSDPVTTVGFSSLRSHSQFELLELSDTDVRVRDMSGNVLLRASTAVGSWTGTGVSTFHVDLDGDGIDELALTDNQFSNDIQTYFYHWNGQFNLMWSSSSWVLQGGANTDGDPQVEMFGFNTIDGHYALLDGLTGTTDLSLPEFKATDGAHVDAFDIDGDGRKEVFAVRPPVGFDPPLVRSLKWSFGNYFTMTSAFDNALAAFPVQTQLTNKWEYLEQTPNDVLLREWNNHVAFQASADIPGWSGVNLRVVSIDLNHDGIAELLIMDGNTIRVVRYVNNNYAQLWSSAAWQYAGMAPTTDSNANEALTVSSNSDGHYAMLDPITGAVRAEFPLFSVSNSGLSSLDFDHDGKQELLFARFSGPTPLSICYRWNGSSYAQLYSHQDPVGGYAPAPYRSPAASELLELTPSDLRVRASDGSLLMLASSAIAGWTGVGTTAAALDVDHDGVTEILAGDAGGARLMSWTSLLDAVDGGSLSASAPPTSSPNPFRSSTSLQFSTRREGPVGIAIYDAGGRVVRRLDQRLPAGSHAVKWDGRDAHGHAAPNGVLFYEVRADGLKQTRKMVHIGS